MATIPHPASLRSGSDAEALPGERLMLAAATAFAIAVLLHGADHVRRGAESVDLDVFWIGTAGLVLEVGVVVLAFQRHRVAPLAAAVLGWQLSAAYVAVHFLPQRGWVSDSLSSATDVSPLSWGAASLEVAASFVLGAAGYLALRARGGLASASAPVAEQRSLGEVLRMPVPFVMLAGNVLIAIVSLVDLAG